MQAATNLLRDVNLGLHRRNQFLPGSSKRFESCEAQLRSEEVGLAWSVYRNLNSFHATDLGTFLLVKRTLTDIKSF